MWSSLAPTLVATLPPSYIPALRKCTKNKILCTILHTTVSSEEAAGRQIVRLKRQQATARPAHSVSICQYVFHTI